MALINCPECEKVVSDTAFACPHCGFGVANYMQETKRIQQELAENIKKQEKRQQNLERRQEIVQAIKSKYKKAKQNQLNLCGKKSFWILAALLPYSVISAVLPYINNYFIRKQMGLLPANDNIISWFARNIWPILPILTLASFALFFIPCVFYIIANHVKNIKVAKLFLILGLVYNVLLFMISVVSNIINFFDITVVIRFLIPLCGYLVLFYKATHGKK